MLIGARVFAGRCFYDSAGCLVRHFRLELYMTVLFAETHATAMRKIDSRMQQHFEASATSIRLSDFFYATCNFSSRETQSRGLHLKEVVFERFVEQFREAHMTPKHVVPFAALVLLA